MKQETVSVGRPRVLTLAPSRQEPFGRPRGLSLALEQGPGVPEAGKSQARGGFARLGCRRRGPQRAALAAPHFIHIREKSERDGLRLFRLFTAFVRAHFWQGS